MFHCQPLHALLCGPSAFPAPTPVSTPCVVGTVLVRMHVDVAPKVGASALTGNLGARSTCSHVGSAVIVAPCPDSPKASRAQSIQQFCSAGNTTGTWTQFCFLFCFFFSENREQVE